MSEIPEMKPSLSLNDLINKVNRKFYINKSAIQLYKNYKNLIHDNSIVIDILKGDY